MNWQALLRPIAVRVANIVARSVVQLVDDSKKMQLVQLGLLADETRSDLERVQNYGFTSVPQPGAEAVALFVGGKRDHGLVIVVDDRRYRIKNLESGEVAMYTDQGHSITIKRGGDVVIDAPMIKLGAGATSAVIKGTEYRTGEGTQNAQLAAQFTASAAAFTALAAASPGFLLPPAAQALATAAGSLTAAATASAAAINVFEGQAATYLSQVSKTK